MVDGGLRLSYEQFFDRRDRWSSALQRLGVRPGDRVATIAPNTHAQLESFYAVPQLGAVLVPINQLHQRDHGAPERRHDHPSERHDRAAGGRVRLGGHARLRAH